MRALIRYGFLFNLAIAGLGLFVPAYAQDASTAMQTGAAVPAPVTVLLPDASPSSFKPDLVSPVVAENFALGPHDLISVFVNQMPEFTRQVRVDSEGKIDLPYLGTPLPVGGRDSRDVAAQVASALVNQRLAVHPEVQVVVLQVESRPVIISGAVRNPGVVQATRPLSLLEAISRAGGLASDAGDRALVTTASTGNEPPQTREVALAVGGASSGEVWLSGGENIRVLTAPMVYAVGALKQPGGFPLQHGQPLTVLSVIALAHGFSDHADRHHALILAVSPEPATPPRERHIDLDDIVRGKTSDPVLQAGEIIYVPDSVRAKGISAALSDAAQALTLAVAYGR